MQNADRRKSFPTRGSTTAETWWHRRTHTPGAMIFKETGRCELYARVCGQYGFTELYVREPQKLYQAHLKAEADSKNPTG